MGTVTNLVFLIAYFGIANTQSSLSPVVTLSQGQIQGLISKSRNGIEYYSFWGIPYAKPPRRFEPPEPAAVPGWNGIRNATSPGSACVQIPFTLPLPDFRNPTVVGSEDCLFINVFTPATTLIKNVSVTNHNDTSVQSRGLVSWIQDVLHVGKKSPLKPVIVYIYGGSFMAGSSRSFGADFLVDNDVLLVTFNYRLSMLGFLNIGHMAGTESRARGNMGLKDQVMAMSWIQENIAKFGGDKSRVTIYGESAGAGAVHYHMLSPASKGLFHRAISSSGSALDAWALSRNPNYFAKDLGRAMGCPTETSNALLDCLMTKDATDLISKSYHSIDDATWSLDPSTPFGPSIETNGSPSIFLREEPKAILASGKVNYAPWIAGMNSNEGLLINAGIILTDAHLLNQLNSNWSSVAPVTFELKDLIPESKMAAAVTEIRNFYFGSANISMATEAQLEALYSDRNFYHATRAAVLAHGRHSYVYPYIFDYADGQHVLGFTPPGKQGPVVLHGDDLRYVFSGNTYGVELQANNTEAVNFSKRWVKLIAGFAADGKPDGKLIGDVAWPAVTTGQTTGIKPMEWFHVDKATSLKEERFTDRMNFWTNFLTKYVA